MAWVKRRQFPASPSRLSRTARPDPVDDAPAPAGIPHPRHMPEPTPAEAAVGAARLPVGPVTADALPAAPTGPAGTAVQPVARPGPPVPGRPRPPCLGWSHRSPAGGVAGVRRAFQPPVSYTHLRAHETPEHLVCRLLLENKKK